jgi:spermidine/putrescine transport system substrate-binding protein
MVPPRRTPASQSCSGDLKDPVIYPTPDIMKNLEFVKDLGLKTVWYDELWTSIESK